MYLESLNSRHYSRTTECAWEKESTCGKTRFFPDSRISKLSYWEVLFLHYLVNIAFCLYIIFSQMLKKHCFVQLQETTIARLAPKQAKHRHLETTSYQYKQTEIKYNWSIIYYTPKLQHPADFTRESQNSLTHQLISSSTKKKIRLF